MQNLRTPGVYIQEISKLPASVAPVATAIPAFVGYTRKRMKGEEEIEENEPVMIRSMLEYEEIFGGPFNEQFTVTLETDSDDEEKTVITIGPNDNELSPYLLYYCMRFFFANGGGKCYVVSVGENGYEEDPAPNSIDHEDLIAGLDALRDEDEPTIIVIPEAIVVEDPDDRKAIYDDMLKQCGDLMDRFSILDVLNDEDETPFDDAEHFRGTETGMSNLSYGAAYYPSLKTTIRRSYNSDDVAITDNRDAPGSGRFHGRTLQTISDGIPAKQGEIEILSYEDIAAGDELIINGHTFTFIDSAEDAAGDIQIQTSRASMRDRIATVLNGFEDDGTEIFDADTVSNSGRVVIDLADSVEDRNTLEISFEGNPEAIGITIRDIYELEPDKTLYNQVASELDKKRLTLYPSSAMAGVYARVDRNRGVWKAPANVSLNLVSEPEHLLTDEEQGPLNVDPTSGKSINAIRKFHQKGTMVWGARTLAGNDNEWRYIPVRRLFIFIEESIKKATEPSVFEPNDANTWSKIKAMIENFLSDIWRDGALAGATPDEAFFVKVGLGETMSANDILNGRLIIEIGVAAVRPAEFIILQFMHKLQES